MASSISTSTQDPWSREKVGEKRTAFQSSSNKFSDARTLPRIWFVAALCQSWGEGGLLPQHRGALAPDFYICMADSTGPGFVLEGSSRGTRGSRGSKGWQFTGVMGIGADSHHLFEVR